MPKCLECNNESTFIVTYVEFEKQTYEGDRIIEQYAGDRERLDYWLGDKYKPECGECDSTNVVGL